MRRKWTDEQFIEAVRESYSVAQVLRAIGLKVTGANYKTVHLTVERLGLITSHWTGQAHRKGKTGRPPPQKQLLKDILVKNSTYRGTSNLKRRLLKKGYLKNECVLCGNPATWKQSPLVLVLDHINGNNRDHRLENLRLLCPNCNSQQKTFAGRNKPKTKTTYFCKDCGGVISRGAKRCVGCAAKHRQSDGMGDMGVSKAPV